MSSAWAQTTVGQVCSVRTGKKDVNQGNPEGAYPFFTCAKQHTYSDVWSFDGEALLVAGNGDVGNLSYYNGKFEAYQRTYVLMDFRHVLPQFLYYVFEAGLKPMLFSQKLGNTMPYIKKGMITDFPLPLPPLEQQKRIVAVLDQAFAALDRARALAEANLADAEALPQAAIDEIFLSAGSDWHQSTLGEVCKFVGGSQPPKSIFEYSMRPGLVRLIQIRDYKTDEKVVYIPKELARRFCSADDVMIGRYGPPLFQILRGIDGAYNVALMKAVPDEKRISKDFLFYFLKNREILRYIVGASSRAAGQIGINKTTIEPYPIQYPVLEEQSRIVERLKAVWRESEYALDACRQKLVDLDDLRQSLLQKAFDGELT